MGLAKQMARFVIREAKHSSIHGSVLLIGRQTVHLTAAQFSGLMREEGLTIDPAIPVTLDTRTRAGAGRSFISDAYLFKALGADSVTAIDVSDYEGAEIVHNLDTPIPATLEGRFDFICNGSVLDNMFNPVAGLHNISRMLKPGGRVIHFEHASNATNNAYLQFSPNWFFDYFVVNRFADCKAYLALFSDLYGSWDFYACLYDGAKEPRQVRSARFAMTCVVAEKAVGSTWDASPVQGQYRSAADQTIYRECLQEFHKSTRPILSANANLPQIRFAIMPLLSRLYASIFPRERGYLRLGKFY